MRHIHTITNFPFFHFIACTHHHYGYCDLSGGVLGKETVADCMKAGLDDSTLPSALKMLPSTIKYIFLNENEGIAELKSGTFKNLANPLGVKAIYFDDCNVTTIDEDAFHPLKNLETLSLNFNKISVLQDDLLKLPKLRHFSIFGDPTPPESDVPVFGPGGGRKPGLITSGGFTNKLFQHTPNLERLIMYGNRGITKLHSGMFNGLSKVHTMFFVFCGLDNSSFSDDVFEPLVSMKYFDFQGNYFTDLNPRWFGEWSKNIERLVYFACDLGPITDKDIFSKMPNLKQVYLDQNPKLMELSFDFFKNNPKLDTLTVGPAV